MMLSIIGASRRVAMMLIRPEAAGRVRRLMAACCRRRAAAFRAARGGKDRRIAYPLVLLNSLSPIWNAERSKRVSANCC
jgi:hypothetical protein